MKTLLHGLMDVAIWLAFSAVLYVILSLVFHGKVVW